MGTNVKLTSLSSGWLVWKDGKRVGLVSRCKAEGVKFFAATNEAGQVRADFPTRDAAVEWIAYGKVGLTPVNDGKVGPTVVHDGRAFWMFGGPKSARDFIESQAKAEPPMVLVAYRVTEGTAVWFLVMDGGDWLPSWITRAMDAGKMKVDKVVDVRTLKG